MANMAKDVSSIVYACICIQLAISVSGETCDPPPTAERSRPCEKENPPFPVGKIVKYCCDAGFRFGGKNRIATCKLNETNVTLFWDIPDLQCQPVSCLPPDPIQNGHVVGSRYTFPNAVKYECNKGYKLRGVNQRYCETNGEWSGRLPVCQIISCPKPDQIANGTVTFSSTEFSSVATYQCSSGFAIKGNDKRRCTHEGIWDGDIPNCVEVICPEPKDPINGKVALINGGRRKGSFISYACNEGTTLRGADFATCMEDGKWSADPPTCNRPCTIPRLYKGKMGTLQPGWRRNSWVFKENKAYSLIEEGEIVLLRCIPEFELPVEDLVPGDVEVICDNGNLKPTPACHPAWCRTPPPDNGVGRPPHPPYSKENGTVIEYEDACLRIGNTLQKKRAVCYRGKWLVTEALCQDARCKGEELEKLSVKTFGRVFYENGEVIDAECKHKYEKSSEVNSIHCIDGQWQIRNSPCKPASCRYPPPSIAGAQASASSGEHGTVVEYRCSPPYQLVERESVTCSYGQWTGEVPSCIDNRCHTNSFIGFDGVKVENLSFLDKEVYIPPCLDGYESKDVKVRCNKGKWISENGRHKFCRPGNCIVPFVAYGEFYVKRIESGWFSDDVYMDKVNVNSMVDHNAELYFHCIDGRKFQGKFVTTGDGIKVTCEKKQWIPKPECWFFPPSTTIAPTTTDKPIKNQSDFIDEESAPVPDNVDNLTIFNNRIDSGINPNLLFQNISKSCEFNNSDQYLLIFFNNKVTHSGVVPDGSRIKFGCQPIGIKRLSGPGSANCKEGEWEPSKFPTCVIPSDEKSVVINFFSSISYETYPEDVVRVPKYSRVDIQCYEINRQAWPRLTCASPNVGISGKNTINYDIAFTYITIYNFTEEYSATCTCSSDVDIHKITILTTENVDSMDVVCTELNATNHLSITYTASQDSLLLPNTKASFTCTNGNSELRGRESITCLENGKWSHDPPICIRKQEVVCPKLNATRHLSITYYPSRDSFLPNTKASFTCTNARSELRGWESITCLEDGSWSHDPPICIQSCWPRPNIANGNKLGASVKPGSVVIYNCHRGFKLVGAKEITCKENGEWSNSSPWCSEIRCPVPVKISNGHVRYTSLLFDSEIEYRCNRGYKLIGQGKSLCTNDGEWDKDPPVCEEDSSGCSAYYLQDILPDGVFGVNITEDKIPEGSVVKLECAGNSQVMIGNQYAICSSKGFWKFGDAKCVPGCNAIKKPPNSSLIIEDIKDESYRFGDFLTFSCPDDEELSIDLERIVCLGNGWSDKRVPTCVPKA